MYYLVVSADLERTEGSQSVELPEEWNMISEPEGSVVRPY